MDVLYLCGEGSVWNNTELKYSLRSLEKNYNADKVHVIGVLPYFLNQSTVNYIPAKNVSRNAAINIMEKIKLACQLPELSDDFIFMNDDYFLLKPLSNEIPFYYKQESLLTSIKINQGNEYGFHLKATVQALNQNNFAIKNFDAHCPIVYNKTKMLQVINGYNWQGLKHGYVMKSLYCNTLGISGEYMDDLKLSYKRFEPQIKRMIHNKRWFSIGDKAINKSLGNVLHELFPNSSKYEIKLLRK